MKTGNHILILGFPGADQLAEIVNEIQLDESLKGSSICFVTDKTGENPPELSAKEVQFVFGNPSSLEVLTKANILKARRVVILADDTRNPDSDGITLMRILKARKVLSDGGKFCYMVVQCLDRQNEAAMSQAGADEVISVESLSAGLIVQGLTSRGINPVLRNLLTNEVGHQFYIEEVPAGTAPQTLEELCDKVNRRKLDCRIVAVLSGGGCVIIYGDTIVLPGTQILYVSIKRQSIWS